MVGGRAGGHGHRAHIQFSRHLLLDVQADGAERAERSSAAAEHRHEHPVLATPEPLDVPDEFVYPDRRLQAERGRDGVLPVRASGHGVVLGSLRQFGEEGQDARQLGQVYAVRLSQLDELAGLGDVLRRGAPVDVSARVAVANPVKLPYQRDEAVAGSRQTLADSLAVHVLQATLADYLLSGVRRNDSEFRFGDRERRFDVQPGLQPLVFREQVSDARVFHSERGGFLLHDVALLILADVMTSRVYGAARDMSTQRKRRVRPADSGSFIRSVRQVTLSVRLPLRRRRICL